MKQDIRVLICYNRPHSLYSNYIGKDNVNSEEVVDLSEKNFFHELDHIKSSLKRYYADVDAFGLGPDLVENIKGIKSFNPGLIFNLVESIEGNTEFEAYTAGLYDLLNITYTGNDLGALGNCLNKSLAKMILKAYDVRVPASFVYQMNKGIRQIEKAKFSYPLMLKLLKEDASIGISERSVVNNRASLKKQLEFLVSTYKQDILIEQFIRGREFNIAVLGGKPLPVSEIDFSGLPGNLPAIVTYEGKWVEGSTYYKHTVPVCPAKISDELRIKMEKEAVKAYRALKCRDYARVDIRLDDSGTPYVIEVNPNPDITRDSGFARAAAAKGMTHGKFLYKITQLALERVKVDSPF